MRNVLFFRSLVVVGVLVPFLGEVPARAANVYVTRSSYEELDQQILNSLTGLGHTATLGLQYFNFSGEVDLSGYDVVLLLPNYDWFAGDMPDSGQQVLVDFVVSGGGLVTSEWLVWKEGAEGAFATLSDAIPVVATSYYSGNSQITYSVLLYDPILDEGMPSSFTFDADDISGTETAFVPKPGAIAYWNSEGAAGFDGVIGWNYGFGRVISFSTVMGLTEMQNDNYNRLVMNAVYWAWNPQ